jgi:hypothetical protein
MTMIIGTSLCRLDIGLLRGRGVGVAEDLNYGGCCYMESHKRWKKTEQERRMREKGAEEENERGGARGSVHENNIMGEAISRTLQYTEDKIV